MQEWIQDSLALVSVGIFIWMVILWMALAQGVA